jgi:TctA family transporter
LTYKTPFPILNPRKSKFLSIQSGAENVRGDIEIFIKKPISATILAIALVVILIPVFKWAWKRYQVPQKA